MADDFLSVPDELTIHHVEALAGRLLAALAAGEALRLDLGAVSRIDTAGIQLLLILQREAWRRERPFALRNAAGEVAANLAFCRLDGLLAG